MDDLAAVRDPLRGDLTVEAMAAFGVAAKTLRWDLTSLLVTGASPEEEQEAGSVRVQDGYGRGDQKQIPYLQVTSDAGAVPLWEQPHDGNTADVGTVVETMQARQKHAHWSDFALIGDSKLLSDRNRQALLPRTPELDAAFLFVSATGSRSPSRTGSPR